MHEMVIELHVSGDESTITVNSTIIEPNLRPLSLIVRFQLLILKRVKIKVCEMSLAAKQYPLPTFAQCHIADMLFHFDSLENTRIEVQKKQFFGEDVTPVKRSSLIIPQWTLTRLTVGFRNQLEMAGL